MVSMEGLDVIRGIMRGNPTVKYIFIRVHSLLSRHIQFEALILPRYLTIHAPVPCDAPLSKVVDPYHPVSRRFAPQSKNRTVYAM